MAFVMNHSPKIKTTHFSQNLDGTTLCGRKARRFTNSEKTTDCVHCLKALQKLAGKVA